MLKLFPTSINSGFVQTKSHPNIKDSSGGYHLGFSFLIWCIYCVWIRIVKSFLLRDKGFNFVDADRIVGILVLCFFMKRV